MAIRIEQVDAGSEAEALGLAPGDELLSVDDNELNDTLDYDFYTDSSSFHLKARVARLQRVDQFLGILSDAFDVQHGLNSSCPDIMKTAPQDLPVSGTERSVLRGATQIKAKCLPFFCAVSGAPARLVAGWLP